MGNEFGKENTVDNDETLKNEANQPTTNSPKMKKTGSFGSSGIKNRNNKQSRVVSKMDNIIRKRVRRGITYNMKLIIRGDRGSGKTSLFQRLKGERIPIVHHRTREIQTTTVNNWRFKHSEDQIKVEIWDVVDEAYHEEESIDETNNETFHDLADVSELPSLRDNAAQGKHKVGLLDANTINVYQGTNGVIFLMDITKWSSLDYVRRELEKVPTNIPTLVIGTFRDCGNNRKIFKEDIHELLYGSERARVTRRPTELHYFECSLLNCYGLNLLHQYFSIPFLNLKLNSLRQQVLLLEGDLSKAKHDIQVSISEQRYKDYLEYVRVSGSDIGTGKRMGNNSENLTPDQMKNDNKTTFNSKTLKSIPIRESIPFHESPSSESNPSISQIKANANATTLNPQVSTSIGSASESPSMSASPSVSISPVKESEDDCEDLPERSSHLSSTTLKIHYQKEEKFFTESNPPKSIPSAIESTSAESAIVKSTFDKFNIKSQVTQSDTSRSKSTSKLYRNRVVENLEDFTVKFNDVDSFYASDGESDEEKDIVVQASTTNLNHNERKEGFLYSDSDDEHAIQSNKLHKSLPSKKTITKSTTSTNDRTKSSCPDKISHPPLEELTPSPTSIHPKDEKNYRIDDSLADKDKENQVTIQAINQNISIDNLNNQQTTIIEENVKVEAVSIDKILCGKEKCEMIENDRDVNLSLKIEMDNSSNQKKEIAVKFSTTIDRKVDNYLSVQKDKENNQKSESEIDIDIKKNEEINNNKEKEEVDISIPSEESSPRPQAEYNMLDKQNIDDEVQFYVPSNNAMENFLADSDEESVDESQMHETPPLIMNSCVKQTSTNNQVTAPSKLSNSVLDAIEQAKKTAMEVEKSMLLQTQHNNKDYMKEHHELKKKSTKKHSLKSKRKIKKTNQTLYSVGQ